MSETERERRRFYRVKEAAAIMGVPLRTMYHLAETGQERSRLRQATDLRPRDLPRAQRRRPLLQQVQELAWHRDEERQDRPRLPRRDLPRRDPHLDQKRLEQHTLVACLRYGVWG